MEYWEMVFWKLISLTFEMKKLSNLRVNVVINHDQSLETTLVFLAKLGVVVSF